MRLKATFAGGLAAALALVGGATADTLPQGGGANNVVIAQTTADGSSLVRSGTQVSQTGGRSVASSNIADATATACTGCDSTAVAVQVVLATGDIQYYTPGNAATAATAGCDSCGAFAYAWQYVLQVSRPVMLSAAAQQEIAQLRDEIASTAASIAPDSIADDQELQAELDSLTPQLKAVVDGEVQHAGAEASGAPVEHVETHVGADAG
jgi:hypothetical protein